MFSLHESVDNFRLGFFQFDVKRFLLSFSGIHFERNKRVCAFLVGKQCYGYADFSSASYHKCRGNTSRRRNGKFRCARFKTIHCCLTIEFSLDVSLLTIVPCNILTSIFSCSAWIQAKKYFRVKLDQRQPPWWLKYINHHRQIQVLNRFWWKSMWHNIHFDTNWLGPICYFHKSCDFSIYLYGIPLSFANNIVILDNPYFLFSLNPFYLSN